MGLVRRQSEANIYHVVTRGTGRQIIFEDDDDRATYLRILSHGLTETGAELYAYCLMSNHVHLLLHDDLTGLSKLMKAVSGTYARCFNEKAERTGHLFQERFRSEPVDDDAYLMTVICYIHNNPAKAGIAGATQYPWSSHSEYLGRDGICSTEFPLAVFGGTDLYMQTLNSLAETSGCLDVDAPRSKTRAMSDSTAIKVAHETLGGVSLDDLKGLPIAVRNDLLVQLRDAGLTIRQVERLTGIGRGSIHRALKA